MSPPFEATLFTPSTAAPPDEADADIDEADDFVGGSPSPCVAISMQMGCSSCVFTISRISSDR